MSDILKGLTSGRWTLLVAWMLPTSVSLVASYLIVLPAADHLPLLSRIVALSDAGRLLLAGFLVFALGVILNEISTPLYRVLEGYSWPRTMRTWAISRQQDEKRRLEEISQRAKGVDQELAFEKLARFPDNDADVVATRLGNALRSFELYGRDRFELDSQTLWSELTTVVPESLQRELEQSRAGVDFFVNFVVQSSAFGLLALAAAIWGDGSPKGLIAAALVSLCLTRIWYVMAITSSTYWHDTVVALVNLGRKNLADALGLALPEKIEKEREMWSLVTASTYFPFDESRSKRLDKFREPTKS